MTAKLCKYGCNQMLEWDNNARIFREQLNAEPHTPDRCKSIRAKKGFADTANKAVNSAYTDKPTLERLERKIEDLKDDIAELKEYFRENRELKEALAKASFMPASSEISQLIREQRQELDYMEEDNPEADNLHQEGPG